MPSPSSPLLTLTIGFTTIILAILTQLYHPQLMSKVSILQHLTKATTKTSTVSTTMSSLTPLSHAKITHRPSSTRGHADHGWLNSYHSFSFASWYDPRYESFGSLRVLNEDRVAPGTGFPTHPHRDAEIFSYILSGELTHRDSMQKRGKEDAKDKKSFYRMKRGDVQFTTGGSGIAHSEQNEHGSEWVHFLQIWALPWKRGLKPTYHTSTFGEEEKRKGFVRIISPLKAGRNATEKDEQDAVPALEGTIPVHADLVFAASIVEPGKEFGYEVGMGAENQKGRRIYLHLPMRTSGKSSVKIDGRDGVVLKEGDGAFVSEVNAGDVLRFESVGEVEAEVVVFDSN